MQSDVHLEAEAEIDAQFFGEGAVRREALVRIDEPDNPRFRPAGIGERAAGEGVPHAGRGHGLAEQQSRGGKFSAQRGAERQMKRHEQMGAKGGVDTGQQGQAR